MNIQNSFFIFKSFEISLFFLNSLFKKSFSNIKKCVENSVTSNKDRQQKKALERYQNFCKKDENRQYSPVRYKNQC